jgi:hypothetical protein
MTEVAAPAPTAARPLRARHPLAWFVVKRILAGLLTLFVVSILVFVGTELLGDPASAILGRNATPENLAEMRELMGLDSPRPSATSTGSAASSAATSGTRPPATRREARSRSGTTSRGRFATRSSSLRSPR